MQSNYTKPLQVAVWGGLLTLLLALAIAFLAVAVKRNRGRAPAAFPVISEVAPFTLTNQLGRRVTLDDLKGKVWIANIIFTRCPGPCAQMTQRMAAIQNLVRRDPRIQLVSLTTDPAYDTPAVLKQYADRWAASPDRWWFLTGSPAELRQLAVDSLKLSALEKSPDTRESENDLFIHSVSFILVDARGRVRGVFQLEDSTAHEVAAAAKSLKHP